MNPKCDLCGREMVLRAPSFGDYAMICPVTPDQHRIAELERQLEEAKLTVYQREVRIETMDAENNRLWNQKNSALSERDEALTALREMAESATAERNACSEKQCEIGRLSAQLRAREADVLALRDALEFFRDEVDYKDREEEIRAGNAAHRALSNTSATAQEIVARIEREAVEEASGIDAALAPPPFCERGSKLRQNLPEWLRVGWTADASLAPGTIEFWQDGKRMGRIEGIGLAAILGEKNP